MKKMMIVLGAVALLATGWMMGAPMVKAATNGYGWMRQMHSQGMWDAMRSGHMWDYMNDPEVKEQLQDTPMGEMMYSEEMQEFMNSDAFQKFTTSPKVQQWAQRGMGPCHGAWKQAPAGK